MLRHCRAQVAVIGQGKRTTVELKAGDRLPTGTRALPPTGTEQDAQDGFLDWLLAG